MREFSSEDQPDRHCLSVTKIVIARYFDGVSQCVSVIQCGSGTTLAFVARNNCCFDCNASGHLFIDRQRIDAFAAEKVVLGDFAETTAVFARRQRCQ